VQNFLMLGVFAGLTFVVGYFTIRSVTRQITSITDLLTQIGIGNFAARAEVLSRDELGRVGPIAQRDARQHASAHPVRAERDAIQASIRSCSTKFRAWPPATYRWKPKSAPTLRARSPTLSTS